MKRKIIWLILLSCILTGGIVLCVVRWNVWFGNQPEEDYVVPVRPNNIVLTYGEDAATERTISWRCDTVLQDACLLLSRRLEYDSVKGAVYGDTVAWFAEGEVIASRAGRAAFYQVELHDLQAGEYQYCCMTGEEESDWKHFCVHANEGTDFVVFGDVQDVVGTASREMYERAFSGTQNVQFAAFVGDIIERPMDKYWQVWFRSMLGKQTQYPIVAATGNHEYLKAAIKRVDSRWTHVFVNPQNGPDRFLGKTYYIDFPLYRFVVIDTDDLQLFSDYTIAQTWAQRVLQESDKQWNIVMMHHPIYTAARKHRDYPLMRLSFREAFQMADVVFCGHDHNYMRREIHPLVKYPWKEYKEQPTVQILSISSEKFYDPKDSVVADKHYAYTRVYERVQVTEDSLRVETWSAEQDTLLDELTLYKM